MAPPQGCSPPLSSRTPSLQPQQGQASLRQARSRMMRPHSSASTELSMSHSRRRPCMLAAGMCPPLFNAFLHRSQCPRSARFSGDAMPLFFGVHSPSPLANAALPLCHSRRCVQYPDSAADYTPNVQRPSRLELLEPETAWSSSPLTANPTPMLLYTHYPCKPGACHHVSAATTPWRSN